MTTSLRCEPVIVSSPYNPRSRGSKTTRAPTPELLLPPPTYLKSKYIFHPYFTDITTKIYEEIVKSDQENVENVESLPTTSSLHGPPSQTPPSDECGNFAAATIQYYPHQVHTSAQYGRQKELVSVVLLPEMSKRREQGSGAPSSHHVFKQGYFWKVLTETIRCVLPVFEGAHRKR